MLAVFKIFDSVVYNLNLFLNNGHTLCKAVVFAHLARQLLNFAVGYRLARFNFCGRFFGRAKACDDYPDECKTAGDYCNNNFCHFKSFRSM